MDSLLERAISKSGCTTLKIKWSIPSDKKYNTVYTLSIIGLFVKSNKSELMEKIFYSTSKKCNQDRQKF